jgi:myo-inositol 2-dehydrogenase/D-chiro-inositol 1-dehydrogenase
MHLPTMHRLRDRFNVVGVHDISPSVMARVAERWQVPNRFASVEALLASPEIEAVLVLSPDPFHFAHASAVLEAGKHLLVEKPACLTPRQVAALAARAKASNRVAMVAYMRRYAPAFRLAKQRLGEIGALSHVSARDFMCEGPWFFRQTSDVAYPAGDVPAEARETARTLRLEMMREVCGADATPALLLAYEYLTGVASHSISAIRDLLGGPPRSVAAAHVSADGRYLVAALDYGSFSVTYEYLVDDIARFDAGFDVYGRTGCMKLGFETPYVRNLPMTLSIQQSTADGNTTENVGPFYKDAFTAELEAFHACVVDGAENHTPIADSIADFDIFNGIIAKLRGL